MLFEVVKSDNYLLYLLELDASGYVEPSNPRRDLTYAQKRDLVRKNRIRWTRLDTVVPKEFELQMDGAAGSYIFSGGVYVQGARQPNSLGDITLQLLHFYRLPSPNQGLEYKHWVISDLDLNVVCFGIDVEQDLLVLIESKSSEEPYRIYIRTMSTNEVHPGAPAGRSTLVHQHPPNPIQAAEPYLEISGCLLAIMFHYHVGFGHAYLVIWNWTTGVELVVSNCMRA